MRAPGMTASDAPHAHPAAFEESVSLDRLLGVAGTGRLVAAARRHPGKDDPIQLDEPDPDALQPVEPPSAPPLLSVRRRAPTSVS